MFEVLNVPVLFLIFRRPDTTKEVFDRIRRARPVRLYIAADGPRVNMGGEAELCTATRDIVKSVDWECQVSTLFREEHYGCKMAVSSAITWFFEKEPEGIILEDDCVPDPTFFRFCCELLSYFREDKKVMMISGTNELGTWKADRQSYHFSTDGVWGWASWRRAWAHFDLTMKRWTESTTRKLIESMLNNKRYVRIDRRNFARVYAGEVDTWDYQWRLARLINQGLTVTPAKNMVSNIGFRPDGTHTRRRDAAVAGLPVHAMEFPLRHNAEVVLDREYVKRAFEISYAPLPRRVRNRLRKLFKRLRGSSFS